MARPIWRGSLSFGLVAIPVQLHTAVRENRTKFRLLHAKDKSPIKYERVCQRDGTVVAWEDLVKGYEYQKGRYVVLTKEDFKAAALEKDRRVQVTDFVPGEAIDDRFFDQPYYLLPDKGGEHAYAVFHQALRHTKRRRHGNAPRKAEDGSVLQGAPAPTTRRTAMPQGDKSAYTDKQKRKAEHIEEGYKKKGLSTKTAAKRAWATVNKEDGGGKKSGSGRKATRQSASKTTRKSASKSKRKTAKKAKKR